MSRRAPLLLLLFPVVMFVAACGGAGSTTGTSTTAQQPGTQSSTDLVGAVGPGFTIVLKQDGRTVSALKAGAYSLVVSDQAATHDFTLKAPDGTLTQITDVPFTGTKTATVDLTPGVWTYFCQPHATQMTGSFTVS
ncbi:MAG: hypothetical protein ACR2JV_04385 [Gaiellales bacterium]